MQSMEHVQTLFENEVADRADPAKDIPAAMVRIAGGKGDSIFATLKRNGTYFDPTLIYYENSIEKAAPDLAARRRVFYGYLKPLVGRASAAGVKILAGTDMIDRPGHWLLVELERLVESGLNTRQALQAATTTAAEAAGRPDLARVAPGATASLLILDADPLADIKNVRRLSMVVLRGRAIGAAELERLRSAQ
jgi:imidazolonepropionase-like amidohydrolase